MTLRAPLGLPKPRLKLSPTIKGGLLPGMWLCKGAGYTAAGVTPTAAYSND